MRRQSGSSKVSDVPVPASVVNVSYLSDEVESNHVSGLGSNRVGGKLELVVRSDRDHHSSGGSSHRLCKPDREDSREEHVVDSKSGD